MKNSSSMFRPQIAIPQDHGSWVFILTPLLIGIFAGGQFGVTSMVFVVTGMAAFLIRQPVTMVIKAYSGRRSRNDLPAAGFWILIYGVIIAGSIIGLSLLGQTYILFLGIPAIPVFTWHLWLVSQRSERRQAGVEILATGVLALAAPAAYWIGKGSYDILGWLLWLLAWLQSAASIVYAYLRLEQRQWKSIPSIKERIVAGKRAIMYSTFNLLLVLGLIAIKIIPPWIWLPFLVQFCETLWGTITPAVNYKPVSIGIRQLIVTIIFTMLFIVTWR